MILGGGIIICCCYFIGSDIQSENSDLGRQSKEEEDRTLEHVGSMVLDCTCNDHLQEIS